MDKTKVIRAELSGQDFLDFNDLKARLLFPSKLTDRQQDEATVRLALSVLRGVADRQVAAGARFLPADVGSLLAALDGSVAAVVESATE